MLSERGCAVVNFPMSGVRYTTRPFPVYLSFDAIGFACVTQKITSYSPPRTLSRHMRPFTQTAVSVSESDVVTVTSPEIQTCIVGDWAMILTRIVEMSAKVPGIV